MIKKEALLFGCKGALGSGVTEVFRNAGFDRLYLFDINLEEGSTANEVWIKTGDLSDAVNAEKAFEAVEPGQGRLLFLFSTLGGFIGGKNIEETSAEEVSKMISMNDLTSFNILAGFKKKVMASSGGSAMFTSAYSAFSGEAGRAAYGASKAAISHLVEAAADEGRENRLSVNAIAPYILDTPANREWIDPDLIETLIKPLETGKFILSVFDNYNFISGNIFKLKYRFRDITTDLK